MAWPTGNKKKSKYKNQKVQTAGHSFASKLEAAVFEILLLRVNAREITIVDFQPRISMTDANLIYIPDFKILDLKTDTHIWVEAKGYETAVYRIKRRLWKHYGPGPLEIWKGTRGGPSLFETVTPLIS